MTYVVVQIALLVELYGMEPLKAIECATANGPLSLGDLGLAPTTGQLKAGFDADVIALLDENPLERIRALTEFDKISYVWKSGKVMRQPGVPTAPPVDWGVPKFMD